MRLPKETTEAIIEVFARFLQSERADLYLFGSRTVDELKGGDIDLLLLVEAPETLTKQIELKHVVLNELKKKIGDRRIDLTIALTKAAATDAFVKQALAKPICLASFPLNRRIP